MLLKDIFNIKNFLVAVGLLATGIGAFGGMPQPPKILIKLTEKYQVLQWLLVYVLIWQGAGGYDEKLSVIGTLILFVIYILVKKLDNNKKLYKFLNLEVEEKKE